MGKTLPIAVIAIFLFSSCTGFWLNGVQIVSRDQSNGVFYSYRDVYLNYAADNFQSVILYDKDGVLLQNITGGLNAACFGTPISSDSLVLLAGYSFQGKLEVYYSRRQKTSDNFPVLTNLNLGLTVDTVSFIQISQDSSYLYFFDSQKLNIIELMINPDGTMSGELKTLDGSLVSNIKNGAQAYATENGRFLVHAQQTQIQIIENPISDSPSKVDLTTTGDKIQSISISKDENNFRIAVAYEEAGSNPVVSYIAIYQYDGSGFTEAYSMPRTGNSQNINMLYISHDGSIIVSLYTALDTYKKFGSLTKSIDGLDVSWQQQIIPIQNYFTVKGDSGQFDMMPQIKAEGPTNGQICYASRGTTGIPLKNGQCQCILDYYWDKTDSICKPRCNDGLASSVNADDNMICDCQQGFIWNQKTNACVVDCNNTQYATKQWVAPDICQCNMISIWNQLTYQCDIDCRIIEGSTGQTTPTGCQCQSQFKWENNQCILNCQQVSHSTGQEDSQNPGQCLCNDLFEWRDNICVTTDCSQVQHSAAGTADSNGNCTCNDGYLWDANIFQCVYDCASAVDALSNGQNAGIHQCQCLSQAIWHTQQNICYRNCELVSFADGNADQNSCLCLVGYEWIDNHLACLPQCDVARGQKNQRNSNGFCLCKDNFTFNPFENKCYRVCKDIDNAKKSFGPTQTSCYCDSGYEWNEGGATCDLSCSGSFDVAVINVDTNQQCSCVTNAQYNPNLNVCELQCLTDTLSTGYDPINKKCVCKQNALWNEDSSVMACQCYTGFDETDGQCLQIVGGSTAIIVGVVSAIISGGSIFAGIKIFKKTKNKKAQSDQIDAGKPESMQNVKKQSDTAKNLDDKQVVV